MQCNLHIPILWHDTVHTHTVPILSYPRFFLAATGLGSRLGDQFIRVRKETNKSHTMEYGTQDWKWSDLVSDFQTDDLQKNQKKNNESRPATATATATAAAAAAATTTAAAARSTPPKDAVDSRDIDLVLAFYKYLRSPSADSEDHVAVAERSAAAQALVAQVQHREAADAAFARVFSAVKATHMYSSSSSSSSSIDMATQVQCERTVVDSAEQHCGAFSSYSLKFTAPLIELCKTTQVGHVLTALRNACA